MNTEFEKAKELIKKEITEFTTEGVEFFYEIVSLCMEELTNRADVLGNAKGKLVEGDYSEGIYEVYNGRLEFKFVNTWTHEQTTVDFSAEEIVNAGKLIEKYREEYRVKQEQERQKELMRVEQEQKQMYEALKKKFEKDAE